MKARNLKEPWQEELLKAYMPAPTKEEGQEIYKLIQGRFCINDAWMAKLLYILADLKVLSKWAYAADIAKENQEFVEIAKTVKEIENGEFDEFSFQIKLHKKREVTKTVNISSPAIVPGLLSYLKILPSGYPQKPKPGNPGDRRKKALFQDCIKLCFDFLEGVKTKDQEFDETEKLYFSGLCLALIGALLSPASYCKKFDDYSNPADSYRKYIADQLKYYKRL